MNARAAFAGATSISESNFLFLFGVPGDGDPADRERRVPLEQIVTDAQRFEPWP